MHMHQQNHWNRVLFYWYQSYHWHQWTISLTNRIRLCLLDMCDPTQATARLVIVLVSRMQKSGTRNNNFVKWKGTFGPTDLQRWSQIFRSDRTEMACSIWFLTKISGILGRMESAPSLSSKKNEYPGENAKRWYRKSNSWLTNFQICQLQKLNKLHTGPSKTTSQ